MALSIVKPNSRPVSVEDFAFLALSRRSFLTAKEIFSEIKRQGFAVSYQAVHKKLKELESASVVNKENSKYSLNRDWLLNTRQFLDSVDQDIIRSSEKAEAKDAVCLSFDSYNDFAIHMLREFVREREIEPGGICITCQKHFYWIFSISKQDYEALRRLGSGGKSYIACEANSLVDKMLAPIYKKLGWRVVTGVNYSENFDLVVYQDWIHQIFFSKEQKRFVERFCKKIKTPEQLTSSFHKDYFEGKAKIKVIVFKDHDLARQLRADAMKYFGK